jgi:hypothetical protein
MEFFQIVQSHKIQSVFHFLGYSVPGQTLTTRICEKNMKHITARATLCAVGIAMVVIPLWPQTQSPQKPSFEVVSVKPNVSGEPPAAIAGLPGGSWRRMSH